MIARRWGRLVGAVLLAAACAPAIAQQTDRSPTRLTGTLQKARETGAITIGSDFVSDFTRVAQAAASCAIGGQVL